MALPHESLKEMARSLLQARRDRLTVSPLTELYPALEESDAYRIQEINLGQREARVGYKLGFTSESMREQMAISGPNYGQLMDAMQVSPIDETVDLSTLIHRSVEPEIAVFVHKELMGSRVGRAEVRRAVRWVVPSLEVVDPRFVDYRFLEADNTADNSSAARFALGPPVPISTVPDLSEIRATLYREREEADHGQGVDAMGDPLAAVAWLVNKLEGPGRVLEAGSVVLTGGLTKACRVGEESTLH